MNDRFKFRGMDKIDSNWHYGYLLTIHRPDRLFIMDKWHSIGGEATIKDELFSSVREVIPETVGQSTGLKDKNGVLIYEGDVVRVENLKAQIQKATFIGVIVFSWASYVLEIKRIEVWQYYNVPPPDPGHIIYLLSLQKDLAVIGNIYENPDLIGGE